MSYLGNEPPQLAGYSAQTKAAPVGSSITLDQEGTINSTLLFLDGVRQTPTTDYTISGTTLTLTSTAPTTAVATILFLGDVSDIGVPSDDTVNVDQLNTTSTGSTGEFLKKTGASAIDWSDVPASGGFVEMKVVSGAWTKPAGVTKIIVEVQGAGGSGSRGTTSAKTMGGGGGGYARKFLDVTNTTSATATVGAGGPSQTGADTSGTAGGLSKFEENVGTEGWDDVIGNGGAEGTATTYGIGAVGGTATGGDILITGGRGMVAGDAIVAGGSFLGIAGNNMEYASPATAGASGYGAGGGGGRNQNSGAGMDGIVIVWEYK